MNQSTPEGRPPARKYSEWRSARMTDRMRWHLGWVGARLIVLASIPLGGCTGKGAPEPVGAEGEPPARIELNEDAYRSVGIEVTSAGHHPVERELRLTGTLDFDEG